MIFKLKKASDWSFKGNVEINTLDELLNFVENEYNKYENGETDSNFGHMEGVVLSKEEDGWQIELYDDYLE